MAIAMKVRVKVRDQVRFRKDGNAIFMTCIFGRGQFVFWFVKLWAVSKLVYETDFSLA